MMLSFKTIVVATDFSAPSELALQYARVMAKQFDASLHLVHVVEEPMAIGTDMYVVDLAAFRERLTEEAERRLTATRAQLEGFRVTSEVLMGSAARAITEAALANNADLIVVGTHGRGALAHLFMGSVAERVVRTAHCPVLTVRERHASTAGGTHHSGPTP